MPKTWKILAGTVVGLGVVGLGVVGGIVEAIESKSSRTAPVTTAQEKPLPPRSVSLAKPVSAWKPVLKPKGTPADPHAYLKKLMPVANFGAEGLESIATISTMVSKDPEIILSDKWKTKAAAACAMLVRASERINQLPPAPSHLAGLNPLLAEMSREYKSAGEEYAKGIDPSGGSDSIYSATARVQHIGELSKQATQMIADFQNRYPE